MTRCGQAAPIGHFRTPFAIGIACCGVILQVTLIGCYSHPTVVKAVDIDIPAVCTKLFGDHDADQDGVLTEEELASVPPLGSCVKRMDINKDGNISQEELQAHFVKVFNPKIGMIGATCRVTHKGSPLSGATVHFIPADYLQLESSTMPIASGTTSSQGIAQMEIHPDYLPPNMPKLRGMVRPGFYLVDVTKAGVNIPACYNSETTLGVEVSAQENNRGPINVALNY